MYKSHGRAAKTVAAIAVVCGSLVTITTVGFIVASANAGATQTGVCDSPDSYTGGSGQYDPICMSGGTANGIPPSQVVYGGVNSSGSWTGHIEISDATDGYDQNYDQGNHAAGWTQGNTSSAIETGCSETTVTIWETSNGGVTYTDEGSVSGQLVC